MNQEEAWSVKVSIYWKTGTVSIHQAERVNPRSRYTSVEVLNRIKELCLEHRDKEIAQILNKEGFKTGYGN